MVSTAFQTKILLKWLQIKLFTHWQDFPLKNGCFSIFYLRLGYVHTILESYSCRREKL